MDKLKILTLQDLSSVISLNVPEVDTELISKAYKFAENTYREKKDFLGKGYSLYYRKNGVPFINHPLEVAAILCNLNMDSESIVAGLLHDVIEDKLVHLASVRVAFGDTVAKIVDGVTKLKDDNEDLETKIKKQENQNLKTKKQNKKNAENFRKLLMAMTDDIRVIFVKFADRLHNMRTIEGHNDLETEKRIAQETLDSYCPLASRLGIFQIKWELEDLSFKVLHPEIYEDIKKSLEMKREERDNYINEVIQKIRIEFTKNNLDFTISGRSKHIYSIYKKMERLKKNFDEILDKAAVRIIVKTGDECYKALGLIHNIFTYIPGTFDDYITKPKANNYKSLHTAVNALDNVLEVQIRTEEMHETAENGIAAHWKYKEGKNGKTKPKLEEKITLLRKVIEYGKEIKDPKTFYNYVKIDLLSEQLTVFTPKGDIIDLPRGSTPLDFAYHIHTEVGNHCNKALINSKIVPLNYKLKNRDVVNIITNKNTTPNRNWITIAKTASARSKIRHFFRQQKKEECIQAGKEILQKEIAKKDLPKEIFAKKNIVKIFKKFRVKNLEDLYAGIGYGDFTANNVINKLVLPLKKAEGKKEIASPHLTKIKTRQGILVDNQQGISTTIAKCCNPIPGDNIIGLRTMRGVTVHKSDCLNIKKLNNNRNNFTQVQWLIDSYTGKYAVKLKISSSDKVGLLNEITSVLKRYNVNAEQLKSVLLKDKNKTIMNILINTKNADELRSVINDIKKIKEVIEVC